MWILSHQYDAGRIARVTNPDEVPVSMTGGTWTDGVDGTALKGAYAVNISRSQAFPRQWRGKQPGCYNLNGSEWCGPEVRWDGRYFVTVRQA